MISILFENDDLLVVEKPEGIASIPELQLIKYTLENSLDLPINYCSFVYKHRFQLTAFRKRNVNQVKKAYEDTTESGYIRTLWVTGTSEVLERQIELFKKQGKESGGNDSTV